MIRKLLPLLLAGAGLAAGIGAGVILRPAPQTASGATEGAVAAETAQAERNDAPAGLQPDYVKLNNQFIVPVVENGRVASMVILSLSLEVSAGGSDKVFAVEPKLRDGMLRVLFDHANVGGFRGSFTDGSNLIQLRKALLEVAQSVLGEVVRDILIVDIMRQDT